MRHQCTHFNDDQPFSHVHESFYCKSAWIMYLLYVHSERLIQGSTSIHVIRWNHSSTHSLVSSIVMKNHNIDRCIMIQLHDQIRQKIIRMRGGIFFNDNKWNGGLS
jgi:hypothetical protein